MPRRHTVKSIGPRHRGPQCRIRRWYLLKRKTPLIKVHMSGSDDSRRDGVIAAISLGVSRITKDDTGDGARCQLMRCSGGDTRIAKTPKDSVRIIGWWRAEEKMMRRIIPTNTTRANVEEQR